MTKPSPFRYFKTSPEIIRMAVMLYVRFPLSLRSVEDLLHERGINNRAENSHLPFRRRERAMLRFRWMQSLQKFAAVHASVSNHFNHERSLSCRPDFKADRAAALVEWRGLCAA